MRDLLTEPTGLEEIPIGDLIRELCNRNALIQLSSRKVIPKEIEELAVHGNKLDRLDEVMKSSICKELAFIMEQDGYVTTTIYDDVHTYVMDSSVMCMRLL